MGRVISRSGDDISRAAGGAGDDIGRAASKSGDDIGRAASGAGDDANTTVRIGRDGIEPDPPPPVHSPHSQKSYEIVEVVRQSAEDIVATVDTINGLAQIAVDCRTGAINPRGKLPATEEVNFVREVCNYVAGNSLPSTNSSSQQNCIGINYNFYPQFYFYPNRPPVSVGVVVAVFPNYPAYSSGLQQGDIIVLVNGQPISDVSTVPKILSTLKAGDLANIKVVRPASYQVSSQGVSVAPPYSQLDFQIPIKQCSF